MPPSQAKLTERFQDRRLRILAVIVLIASAFGIYNFAYRSYASFTVLTSAYEVGIPALSTLRGWMTLEYISANYNISPEHLDARLDLPADTLAGTPLFAIAEALGKTRVEFIHSVQLAIADEGTFPPGDTTELADETGDTSLVALLTHSYPALALVLFLGAMGAPVPSSFSTVLAGVLSADGTMDWALASGIVVAATLGGDVAAYGVGRYANDKFMGRYGRYIGYSGKYWKRVEKLFSRWGGITIFATRTFVSTLSSVASLFAGLTKYSFTIFLVFAFPGRVLWTAAYFGAGYFLGANIEASSEFLRDATVLLLLVILAGISAYYLIRWWDDKALHHAA